MDAIRAPCRGRGPFVWAGFVLVVALVAVVAMPARGRLTPTSRPSSMPAPGRASRRAAIDTRRSSAESGARGGLAGPAAGGGSASGGAPTQEITVDVHGGPFVAPPPVTDVRLTSDGHRLIGSIGGLRVMDARGTFFGWRVSVAVEACRGGAAKTGRHDYRVIPTAPTVIDGDATGLRRGHPRTVAGGTAVSVLAAAPGHGAGTFEAHAVLELPAASPTAASCTLAVRAQLAGP